MRGGSGQKALDVEFGSKGVEPGTWRFNFEARASRLPVSVSLSPLDCDQLPNIFLRLALLLRLPSYPCFL